jgi:hypothetical protein
LLVAETAAKTIKNAAEQAPSKLNAAKETSSKVTGEVGGFLSQLQKEISKDFQKITGLFK